MTKQDITYSEFKACFAWLVCQVEDEVSVEFRDEVPTNFTPNNFVLCQTLLLITVLSGRDKSMRRCLAAILFHFDVNDGMSPREIATHILKIHEQDNEWRQV